MAAHSGDRHGKTGSETVHFEKERGVTGVWVTRGISHVTLEISGNDLHARRLTVLQSLADANLPVFLTKLLPSGLSFALRESEAVAGTALITAQAAETHPVFLHDLALITIVAGAMRDLSGVMSGIYEVMVEQNVAVRQTGDAYNAVHCLIAGADADRAARALRERFGLTPT